MDLSRIRRLKDRESRRKVSKPLPEIPLDGLTPPHNDVHNNLASGKAAPSLEVDSTAVLRTHCNGRVVAKHQLIEGIVKVVSIAA